jgi:glycosyltransferase involved in cell wall biosynthesis
MEIKPENLCALICAFNEERTIGEVVSRTKPCVGEVIVIDDGSKDQTANNAKRNGARVISHSTNLGKGAALKTGFNYFIANTNYEALVTLDADLQHLPEEIAGFLSTLADAEVAIGKRNFSHPSVPLHRRLGNGVYAKVLSWAAGKNIYDPENGFRAFRREPLLALYREVKSEGFTYEAELLLAIMKSPYSLDWTPISTVYYEDRKSKIKPLKHLKQSTKIAWDMVINKLTSR